MYYETSILIILESPEQVNRNKPFVSPYRPIFHENRTFKHLFGYNFIGRYLYLRKEERSRIFPGKTAHGPAKEQMRDDEEEGSPARVGANPVTINIV